LHQGPILLQDSRDRFPDGELFIIFITCRHQMMFQGNALNL
jgi:hypothetical protein